MEGKQGVWQWVWMHMGVTHQEGVGSEQERQAGGFENTWHRKVLEHSGKRANVLTSQQSQAQNPSGATA